MKTKNIIIATITEYDTQAAEMPFDIDSFSSLGPIATTTLDKDIDDIIIMASPESELSGYLSWLKSFTFASVSIRPESPEKLRDTDYRCEQFLKFCIDYIDELENVDQLNIYMGVFPSAVFDFVQTSSAKLKKHVSDSNKKIYIYVRPVAHHQNITLHSTLSESILNKLTNGCAVIAPEFESIIHKSKKMSHLIKRAQIAAGFEATVLIEGESGTGKELLARAIHKASNRSRFPFKAVNCGAIPQELVESEFFGHVKGSFTGAVSNRDGYFRCSDGGTLFLDEIGELPLASQVKILRVIQENEVTPVGATKAIPVNVRIIAATNRSLNVEVQQGRFREDLFYRLAVVILKISPLRERIEDLEPLIGHIMSNIDNQSKKELHILALGLLERHPWYGNVRELQNTLLRAFLWSGNVIQANDVRDALFATDLQQDNQVLERPITPGFNLQGVLDEVARHYLERAAKVSRGNKTKAAKLLGLNSPQTFTNWCKDTGAKIL